MKHFILIVLTLLPFLANAELADRIVAAVNTEIVTESDLQKFATKITKNGAIDDLLLFGQKPESLKGNRAAQLDYLINERILQSEIKRLNLSVTLERVEQEIRDIAKRNGVSRAELMNAIKNQGLSASEYQDFIKSRVERQSLLESEISSKIRVSDEDVQAAFLKQNPKAASGVAEVTLAHILFNPGKSGGVAAAKARAESVLARLKQGESFDALAEQNSEDPGFTSGGLLGTFHTGELAKEMEVAVQNLNQGDLSEVVQTRMGIHIIKVLSKKMTTDPLFEREKEKIRNQLFEVAFQKHLKSWLETKREEGFVRINNQ